MNKKGQLSIFIIIIIIVAVFLIYLNFAHKPSVGDCMDVSKYGEKETQRYCSVKSVGERVAVYAFRPTEYSVGLDGSRCQAFFYNSCQQGTSHPETCIGGWYPLDGVNTIDAHKVDKKLCGG